MIPDKRTWWLRIPLMVYALPEVIRTDWRLYSLDSRRSSPSACRIILAVTTTSCWCLSGFVSPITLKEGRKHAMRFFKNEVSLHVDRSSYCPTFHVNATMKSHSRWISRVILKRRCTLVSSDHHNISCYGSKRTLLKQAISSRTA